ncbi:hypothetical protein GCM10008932_22660 [Alkalibacterium iburiense]|uniref:Transposase n=1 Tax=Alkalibacterium iburiense TaxID=290589 RepID=A0ABN0XRQ1_9LACT
MVSIPHPAITFNEAVLTLILLLSTLKTPLKDLFQKITFKLLYHYHRNKNGMPLLDGHTVLFITFKLNNISYIFSHYRTGMAHFDQFY